MNYKKQLLNAMILFMVVIGGHTTYSMYDDPYPMDELKKGVFSQITPNTTNAEIITLIESTCNNTSYTNQWGGYCENELLKTFTSIRGD